MFHVHSTQAVVPLDWEARDEALTFTVLLGTSGPKALFGPNICPQLHGRKGI